LGKAAISVIMMNPPIVREFRPPERAITDPQDDRRSLIDGLKFFSASHVRL
jgi:hypothetical protein